MYCPLIDRFRGAFLGSAIAETESSQATLTSSLLHESQQLFDLPVFSEAFSQDGRPTSQTDANAVAQTVLMTLMLHDIEFERFQALQNSQGSVGAWLLSQALALRLNGQMATFEALHINSEHPNIHLPDCHPLLASLEGLITQRVTLEKATQAIATLPNTSELDQAIALAVYCWICTPQHFNIGVRRSHRALRDWPYQNGPLIPAITGVIAGVSVGGDNLPSTVPQVFKTLTPSLISTGDRLFHIWSGVNPENPEISRLQQTVISQMDTLKPRDSETLALNSEYE